MRKTLITLVIVQLVMTPLFGVLWPKTIAEIIRDRKKELA